MADLAYVQHMIWHLDENGAMAVVLSQSVLFKPFLDTIRKYWINEKNCLDCVIALPGNIFYETSMPTVILVFKKSRRQNQDILFIDASNEFEKIKNRKKLRSEDIDKIINAYAKREEIDNYSHKAPIDEIRENNFILNVSWYTKLRLKK